MDYTVAVELDRALTDPEAGSLTNGLAWMDPKAAVNPGIDRPVVTVAVTDRLEQHENIDILPTLAGYVVDAINDNLPDDVCAYALSVLPAADYDALLPGRDIINVPLMMSVAEAATRLSVSEQRVRQLLASKKLLGWKLGRDWLVSPTAITQRLTAKQGT